MRTAARQVVDVLDAVIKPVLIIALGGVRPYSDRAFGSLRGVRVVSRGVLHTSIKRQERPWSVSRGTWRSGHPFLYVSASGIHPSLPHVSQEATSQFLGELSHQALHLTLD